MLQSSSAVCGFGIAVNVFTGWPPGPSGSASNVRVTSKLQVASVPQLSVNSALSVGAVPTVASSGSAFPSRPASPVFAPAVAFGLTQRTVSETSSNGDFARQ